MLAASYVSVEAVARGDEAVKAAGQARRHGGPGRLSGMPRLVAALLAGAVVAWGVSSCGSDGSGTVASQAQGERRPRRPSAGRPPPRAARRAHGTGKTTATGTDQAAAEPKAEPAEPKAKSATTTTTTETKTVTQDAKTKTVTQPAATTKTATATQPAQTSTSSTVTVAPTSTAAASDDGGGDLPWWAWLLIVLGVVAIGFGLYGLGRRRRHAAATDGGVPPPPASAGDAPASAAAEGRPADPRAGPRTLDP